MAHRKLDFFIAGVQKAGTTALAAKLRAHPDVALPARKELHFFDDDGLDWNDPPYGLLDDAFAPEDAGKAVRGEATPIYTWWPGSLDRLARYNPEARLVILLRHPAWRALSHWRMETARGAERLRFELAVSHVGRLRARRRSGRKLYSYVERGRYAEQMRAVLDRFPRERVLFLTTDALWRDEAATLARVHRFLGVPEAGQGAPAPTSGEKYIVPVDASRVPEPSPDAVRRLSVRYADEIRRTAEITGLDLSPWLAGDYAEPMAVATHRPGSERTGPLAALAAGLDRARTLVGGDARR